MHAACYGSAPRALAYVLRHGGSLKGCDATGRTPLHYACSARTPCFEIALQILAREPRQAHAFDARGKRALSSVPDDNRRAWCEFIYANRRALRGLASPEPRLVPPRVASLAALNGCMQALGLEGQRGSGGADVWETGALKGKASEVRACAGGSQQACLAIAASPAALLELKHLLPSRHP